jgi:hypothetical protein
VTRAGEAAPGPDLQPESILAPARPRLGPWKGPIGFLLGIGLLGLVGWSVLRDQESLRRAWESVRGSPWWLIALALVLPLCNWLLVSCSFWLMMRRHGRVGPGEMTALIGAAWLLNYLPLRAGMVGRVAYHKAVNRISIRDSVRVMVYGMAIGLSAVMVALGLAVLVGRGPAGLWAGTLAIPLILGAAATGLMRRSTRGWIAAVFALRYLDMLAWVGRYAVVFALIGRPIDLGGAAAIAVACQLALCVPLIGNGLGLRELAVGLMAAALPAWMAGGELAQATGSLADLVNRAAELVVAVPVGVAAIAWLGRRRPTPARVG